MSVLAAAVLVAAGTALPAAAHAAKVTVVSGVQEGQTIENDVFLYGDSPVLWGVVNGDAFVVGAEVAIPGDVNGSLFILAKDVDILGHIQSSTYVLAISTRIQSGASIGRSLYSLGLGLITEAESTIGRDLSAAALNAHILGQTARDTRMFVGVIELLRLMLDRLRPGITGLLPVDAEPANADLAVGGSGAAGPENTTQAGQSLDTTDDTLPTPGAPTLGQTTAESRQTAPWLRSRLLSLLLFVIVGSLTLWVFPRPLGRWVDTVRTRPLASAGYGTLILINGFLLPVVITLLIGAAVLGLLYVSLPSLAWMVLGASLGTATAAFSIFLIVVTYVTKTIVALWAGSILLTSLRKDELSSNPWLAMLLGLVLFVALASLPYFGFALGLVASVLGLGAIWLARPASASPRSSLPSEGSNRGPGGQTTKP